MGHSQTSSMLSNIELLPLGKMYGTCSSEAEDISYKPVNANNCSDSFHEEQMRDPALSHN